jgi:hypothetical protein
MRFTPVLSASQFVSQGQQFAYLSRLPRVIPHYYTMSFRALEKPAGDPRSLAAGGTAVGPHEKSVCRDLQAIGRVGALLALAAPRPRRRPRELTGFSSPLREQAVVGYDFQEHGWRASLLTDLQDFSRRLFAAAAVDQQRAAA